MDNVQTVLLKFAEAWSTKRLDDVVDLFDEKGVYFASVGPSPGQIATGHSEIRNLIETMFSVDQGAVVETSEPVIFADGAFWTWKYTMPNGAVELGCDFLCVKDGKILLKDAYRKLKR
jgi:hypothetical protein